MSEIGPYESPNANASGHSSGVKVRVLVPTVSEGSTTPISLNVVRHFGGGGLSHIVSKYVVIGSTC